jgi:hypothetical protein
VDGKRFDFLGSVGSICPKIATGDAQDPNFGYNPAMRAIVDRMAEKLAGSEQTR